MLCHYLTLILMPGLDLLAGCSVQSEALSLGACITGRWHLILRHRSRLLFRLKRLGVLQLLRAQEASLVIRAVLLLVIQIRAYHPRVSLLLMLHWIFKFSLGQALHDITSLRLFPDIKLVLLDVIGVHLALPFRSSVLSRHSLLALYVNILSGVVESQFAALGYATLHQSLGIDVLVVRV